MYSYTIRKGFMNVFKFLAILIWAPFFFTTVWPFVNAAIKLDYINVQTIGYTVYTVILLLFSITMIIQTRLFDKRALVQGICYTMAAVIMIATIADLITYKAFIGYTFTEDSNDAIFVNLIMNSPNWIGVIGCIVLAALYVLFAKILYSERSWIAFIIYVLILLVDGLFPILYSTQVLGVAPRSAWLKKALFILPQQLFLIISFAISLTHKDLWSSNF